MMSIILVIFMCGIITISEAVFCSSPKDETLYIYPSPNNCSTFITCIDNEEYEFDCLLAPMFENKSEALCLNQCSTVGTTKKGSSKTVSSKNNDFDLYPETSGRAIVCPLGGASLASIPSSCTDYISCYEGIGTRKTCPIGFEFYKYECVPKQQSKCVVSPMKGTYHIKCRYDKGQVATYFASDSCDGFKKCTNQLAYEAKCAHGSFWDDENKICDWTSNDPKCNKIY
ncbi:unnamed protein product [Diamesa serratosioi]